MLDSTTKKNMIAQFPTKHSETTATPEVKEQVTTDAGRSSSGNLKRPLEGLESDVGPGGLGYKSRSKF